MHNVISSLIYLFLTELLYIGLATFLKMSIISFVNMVDIDHNFFKTSYYMALVDFIVVSVSSLIYMVICEIFNFRIIKEEILIIMVCTILSILSILKNRRDASKARWTVSMYNDKIKDSFLRTLILSFVMAHIFIAPINFLIYTIIK